MSTERTKMEAKEMQLVLRKDKRALVSQNMCIRTNRIAVVIVVVESFTKRPLEKNKNNLIIDTGETQQMGKRHC